MIDRNHLKYVHETLDPLIGATIVGCDLEPMGPHSIDAAPVLILSTPSGQRVRLSAWRDDEGNGGGALVVTHVTKPEVRKKKATPKPGHVYCSVIGSTIPHSAEQCAVSAWFDCGCDKPLCSAHAKQTLAENAIYRSPEWCGKKSCVVPAIVKTATVTAEARPGMTTAQFRASFAASAAKGAYRATPKKQRPAAKPLGRSSYCLDCGKEGERIGHMGCEYPENH